MTEENTVVEATEETPSAKKKTGFFKTRKGMVVIVVVAVILIAGGGFWAWHNTPGFCGTMCHNTMGNYVDGYEKDTTALSYQHGHIDHTAAATLKDGASDKNLVCLDCHPATLDLQIKEAVDQIAGTYTVDTDGNVVITGNKAFEASKEFCLKCHDYEKVIAATENYNGGKHDSESAIFNPHASHQGDLECGTCHNVHGTSTMYCTSCHNAEVPEGWQTVAESLA